MAVELQELDLISIFTTLQPITGMELKGHHLLYQILRLTRTLDLELTSPNSATWQPSLFLVLSEDMMYLKPWSNGA